MTVSGFLESIPFSQLVMSSAKERRDAQTGEQEKQVAITYTESKELVCSFSQCTDTVQVCMYFSLSHFRILMWDFLCLNTLMSNETALNL